jgi:hypothetical protein
MSVLRYSFIHHWLYSPLLVPGLFFSFVIFFTQMIGLLGPRDQPVARPLPTHRTTQTLNKRTYRQLCLEWDSNPQFQLSSERRHFMP